jgi:uncharacterized protein YndB with AHSA1/START domain
MDQNVITIQTVVKAPIEKVWEFWTEPKHVMNWAFASDDWEAPSAENDLRIGGTFKTVMAAKDKSASFDFGGTYTDVKDKELIEYTIDDGRHVKTTFTSTPQGVQIVQSFEPEKENSESMQQSGWQSILDNFKKYTESKT